MTTIKGTPQGYEDAVEVGPTGWAVWKKREDGKAPCPQEECYAPYNAEDPAHAIECPECGEVGCDDQDCFYAGRGCPCPACEDDDDETA